MAQTKVERSTVDVSKYPELVVMYLGMRVKRLHGIKLMFGLGPQIADSANAQPDGLLRHENLVYSVFPLHVGMRQYWRDPESMLKWSRSDPHRKWWQEYLRDSGGTGFWHETYFMRGGMEAIYDDMPDRIGLMSFLPIVPARGPMFGAMSRAGKEVAAPEPVLKETELYEKEG